MRLLVVEDQEKMANFLSKGLTEAGYAVDQTNEGLKALDFVSSQNYDLIVLDVMLPDITGFEVSRRIRKLGYKGAILLLTALQTTKDKIEGLDSGADDYLTKPFSFDELLARVRALLRRFSNANESTNLKYADLELDLIHRKVKRSNQEITLTVKEFSLLEYFVRNAGRPLTRAQIADHVWNIQFDTETNVIDVYINILRKKTELPNASKLIHTIVGLGYVLENRNK